MIYSDGKHLVADTVHELHDFACRLGLRFEWFQNKNIPYYDLKGNMIPRAFRKGAKYLPAKELVGKYREHCFRCGGNAHCGGC